VEVELPEQVQRQLDQAAALERQMFGQASAPEGNTEAPTLDVPQAEQPVEPVQQAPVARAPEVSEETWQQKYHVLYGKYQAEVPRLNAQVKELNAKVSELLASARQPEPEPEKSPSLITDADEETYGKDMIDMQRRVSQEEFARLAKKFDETLEQKVKPVQERLIHDATQRFWNTVETAVPDFEQINNDPRWFQYLDTRIPGTRTTYRTAANDAIAQHDAEAVVEMILDWKQRVAPPPEAPQAQTRAQAELQKQVAPTSRKTHDAPAPVKTFTAAEFRYWNDPRRYHDKDASEVDRMIGELDLAQAEGRVRW